MCARDMTDSDDESISEKQLKLIFVGEPNVGKTSIIRRFCYDEFTRQYIPTAGADFYIKRVSLPGRKEVSIRMTDIGGLEMNGPMLEKYLFNCNLIVLVYDITNFSSFEKLLHWMQNISKCKEDPPYVAIFGNKIIEKYTENIRFCIICNYISKIIPALQSRCTRFRFGPLTPEQILPRMNYVIDEEKIKIDEGGKNALLTLANGDMRKVLNVLQSTWLAYKDVTEDNVYTCVGHPLRSDIENIVKWLFNEDFSTTWKNIQEVKVLKGLALIDIITEVHKYVMRVELPFDKMITLLDKMAQIEHRLSVGVDEKIQLTALVSAFYFAKQIASPEGNT